VRIPLVIVLALVLVLDLKLPALSIRSTIRSRSTRKAGLLAKRL